MILRKLHVVLLRRFLGLPFRPCLDPHLLLYRAFLDFRHSRGKRYEFYRQRVGLLG